MQKYQFPHKTIAQSSPLPKSFGSPEFLQLDEQQATFDNG
jgi:hypothetical protein